MTKISIMQGRLLPPFEGRFQAYPANDWEKEFHEAAKLGLYSIEWIYEKPHENDNLFFNDSGIENLKKIIRETNIQVKSICADYYMTELLIKNAALVKENWEHLEWLCSQAKKLEMTYIVLPFVDNSSLKNIDERKTLIAGAIEFLKKNKNLDIEIHLETDMKPEVYYDIFEETNNSYLKMHYDTGNSASLGYNPDVEFKLLGKYLGSVHIKDRKLHDKTVPFGTGDTEFTKCFSWFKKLNFDRWYVLQGARGVSGQEPNNIVKQRDFVLEHLNK